MIEIQLGNGGCAQVDDQDYEELNKHSWTRSDHRKTSYAYRTSSAADVRAGKSKTIRMHRFLLNANKIEIVDHKDGNGLNNQRENLRFCNSGENSRNRQMSNLGRSGPRTSKYKGVSLVPDMNRWRTCIELEDRSIHVGYFSLEVDAALAYNEAAIKYHGEFARLNIIDMNQKTIIDEVCSSIRTKKINLQTEGELESFLYEYWQACPPAAAGGREGFIQKVCMEFNGQVNMKSLADFMRSNWPDAGVAEPGMRWEAKYIDLIQFISALTPSVAENYMRHDYRSMWDTWEMLTEKIKEVNYDPETGKAISAPSAPSPVGVTREGFIKKVIDKVNEFGKLTAGETFILHEFMRWDLLITELHPGIIEALQHRLEELNKYLAQYGDGAMMSTEHEAEIRGKRNALLDYLQGKAITPADPGSQVEAGKFAEWASQNGWSYHGGNAMWYSSRTHEGATTADLITLYKQSL